MAGRRPADCVGIRGTRTARQTTPSIACGGCLEAAAPECRLVAATDCWQRRQKAAVEHQHRRVTVSLDDGKREWTRCGRSGQRPQPSREADTRLTDADVRSTILSGRSEVRTCCVSRQWLRRARRGAAATTNPSTAALVLYQSNARAAVRQPRLGSPLSHRHATKASLDRL